MVFQESKGPGATEDLQELLFLGLKAKGAHQGIQVSSLLFVTVLSALDTILCQVVPGSIWHKNCQIKHAERLCYYGDPYWIREQLKVTFYVAKGRLFILLGLPGLPGGPGYPGIICQTPLQGPAGGQGFEGPTGHPGMCVCWVIFNLLFSTLFHSH